MSTADRLAALTQAEIERIVQRYATARDWEGFRREMARAIAAGHSAATWAAVAERNFGGKVSNWLWFVANGINRWASNFNYIERL